MQSSSTYAECTSQKLPLVVVMQEPYNLADEVQRKKRNESGNSPLYVFI